jgi:alpha-glucosidase
MLLNAGLAAQTAPRVPAPPAKPDVSVTPAGPATHAQPSGEVTDPVADPKAQVTLGHARFTVLTPELIRMEWAADGKFEDHASFVFLNRRLPVPKYETTVSADGQQAVHTIKTSSLTLTYIDTGDGRFTADTLSIDLTVDGKQVTWHPGLADPENLQGTTRTLDGARGSQTREPIEQGLVSRSGWALVDDSNRPLFDSADFSFKQGEKSPWPWVIERPAGERQDWYFFGYGHDYRKALGDYVRVAGRIPLPPRFALAPGGRATGITPIRNSMSWCAASTRTTSRSTCW